MTIAELRTQRKEKLGTARRLIDAAEKERRDLTEDEQQQVDGVFAEIEEKVDPELRRHGKLTELESKQAELDKPPAEPQRRSAPIETSAASSKPEQWRCAKTGKEIRVLKPDQSYESIHPGNGLSLGKAIRALCVGSWEDAECEQRALSTTANPSAGILVPSPLAASVIDKARARSVLQTAGSRLVDMPQGTLTIARVATDPTVEIKAENSAFAGSDATFDGIELTAYTMGILLKASRELIQDAPNVQSLIENVLARAIAEKIDRFGIQGSGSAQPLGIRNFSGTNTESVGGAVDFDNVLTGISTIEIDNHVPNAILMSPANANVLRQLKVNSEANHYAVAPPAVTALQNLVSTNVPDTDLVVGDFTQFLIGMRQGVMIEVSSEADTAFAAHQLWIKCTVRVCYNVEHRDAFCLLQSIS